MRVLMITAGRDEFPEYLNADIRDIVSKAFTTADSAEGIAQAFREWNDAILEAWMKEFIGAQRAAEKGTT